MKKFLLGASLIVLFASSSFADEALFLSGSLSLRGVEALESDSAKEDPSLTGRIKVDIIRSTWRFHSWLEGGWDGSVKRPAQDHSLFKNYDMVYQSNTPYLEFKELFVAHGINDLDLRAGIQRFSWGRLDEYPVNDLLNPWDYTQFLRKPLEDRKIGVPSVSASMSRGIWTYDAVWVPWLVPYRLPLPNERWAGESIASALVNIPNAEIVPGEPDLPQRTIENGNIGVRARHTGAVEWALNLFHGFDPRPVFKATALVITPRAGGVVIDPGYVPDFHRITSIGVDAATAQGAWSLRAEAAYAFNRWFNIRRELWGYPSIPAPGVYPLNPIEHKSDALDYGIGVDYRLFEDGLLTMQAQQTVIIDRPDTLYEQKIETILWVNLKAGWMNQKIETSFNVACNPEHGDTMIRANGWYVFTDYWKAGISVISLNGPSHSLFGRFSNNDQVETEIVYSW